MATGDASGVPDGHDAVEFLSQIEQSLPTQRPFEVDAGSTLFHQGVPLASAFFLQRGVVKRAFLVPAGKQFLLDVLRPPALVNLTLIEPVQQVTATAVERARVVSVPLQDYLDWLGQDPERWRGRLRQYSLLIQRLQHRIGLLAYYGVRERLLLALLELARVWGPDEDGEVTIPLQGQDLAEMVGVSRETVVRELGALKKRGLIQVGHGHITISRLDAFRDHCRRSGLELD